MDTGGGGGADTPKPEPESYPPTYFSHPEHQGLMYAHIAFMTVAWILLLPPAVMLSLARSRYTAAVQLAFLAANATGVFFSTVYNARTPDLYPNNAHHKLGWLVTWVMSAQVLVGLLGRVMGVFSNGKTGNGGARQHAFMPISREALDEHQRLNEARFSSPEYHRTDDNRQDTESLRSQSLSTTADGEAAGPLHNVHKEYAEHEEDDDLEVLPALLPHSEKHPQSLFRKAAGMISDRAWKVLVLGYNFVDRTSLILGFIALCTGIVAYGRFFEGHGIFSGLAHWIKGGVFFWLGLFTLGRWSGAFGELGWAWNMKPKSADQKWTPSAEFCESFLIFFYGITNIFLEHLGGWGGAWTPRDLEHISITVLFIGGGLCGMLVESVRIRDLLNTTVTQTAHTDHVYQDEEERDALCEPEEYKFSINPVPALVILLLGIMMSSHTQHNMISSMVHKQWGTLLTGCSFCRGLTYVTMWLKPPRSVLPSRPPTELLASFALMAGGIIFMASSGDTVEGMIHYDLDAMFMYTVTLGFVGLLMAWAITCMALKGWAVRREAGHTTTGLYRMTSI
ncbi:hypothetical protein CONLIGDRAFT_581735 [Coniochaeta ligniaria NRRL 30616]|uniref:Integral membrane protein n=1 Tax=Coniochaeta ligniaria NRRL 30616 TaxID=1408157 RepID=A0A1J7JCE2_9PEZI|nr:hypothetical protein CONLIGDRAFT_581735 [Coniochaeta ligniaria NRRL 30616]